VVLGLTLRVEAVDEYPVGLRLSRDADGQDKVLTTSEALRAAVEELRLAKQP
jgi:hypothetical protein